ncbi:Gfo/Idh/MocA family oxidoreductase [Candidatus Wolfebacteria bacterium]|nr:Gfo/Idh/MocA family oxidoreductase [Candidatus Wolfebacteria bacterium]
MRILTGKKWRSGFLDYCRNKNEYRVQVLAWKNLEKIEDAYHTRAKSLRLLINYFPVVGFQGLFTKTWSRLREERRNEKYVSCGIGKIIESADSQIFPNGELVCFVAPFHPALAERIVLPKELIYKIDKSDVLEILANEILYFPIEKNGKQNAWWKDIKGWSVYSGIEIPQRLQNKLADEVKKEIKNTDWSKAQKINTSGADIVAETRGKIEKINKNKKSGILFGYGNYAKINIIPYTKKFVDIKSIHEIDPTQIVVERGIQKWDSSPFPAKDEKTDVYFVASYNHTHVPITLHALNQGAYVVVEKPAAMDYDELNDLEKALRKAGRKLFIGFHKRYGLFNELALKDLGVKYGNPISYHSIVYELIQPEFFWYNWPVSRSTFLSNGCHQIDHFLHLNNFSKPINSDIKLLQDGAVEVWIELENGATLTTTFSEKGSLRVGPRDIVELKVHGKNIRITDAIKYQSEDNHRIIRKKRIFKTNSYRDMYQTIVKKIANNEEGDSIESIIISTKIMLDLEEKLQKMKGWGDKYEKAKKNFWSYFQ